MRYLEAILIIIFILFLAGIKISAQDQSVVAADLSGKRLGDSLKSAHYLEIAEDLLIEGRQDSLLANIQRSLDISTSSDFPLLEASGYELLGLHFESLSKWEETLINYLKALSIYNRLNIREKQAFIFRKLGTEYYDLGIYKKAASYFEQEFFLYSEGSDSLLAKSSESAALAYFYLPDDSLSVKWLITASVYYERVKDREAVKRCALKLATLNISLGEYEKAAAKYNQLLDEYILIKDYANEAIIFNNLGFLRFRQKDFVGAINHFMEAASASKKSGSDPGLLTDVYSNIAICHQTLGQQEAMMDNFRLALGYAVDSKRENEIAELNHLIALIYFNKGDNYHAEIYCQDCIEAAKRSSDHYILQECYKTYSEVEEKGNDFIKALLYYENYLSIRDSLNFENRLREQNETDRLGRYEAMEQRIRLDLADEEIQGLALKTLRAESSRKENAIKLLQKERELERSETERQSQTFALEKERFVLNLREQEVMSLQQRQRSDSLQLILKQNETDALDRQNKSLEREKQLQELDIQKQKQIKRLAVGVGVLMIIVAIMILAGLISTRKKNQKLAESKLKIENINADLEVKNKEILRQKNIIEQKNQSITDSIQYASRIQTAVLPPAGFLSEWGFENFILFKPKDIVSGDFFWGMKKKGKFIIAAADCTGHGVPGAFMSMLGHAFLDEIMNTRESENAAIILNSLRDEVINTLRQRGMVGETRDGMDISLCIIDRQAGKLEFAGANNPLYFIRDNNLRKIQGDKMPIGIHVSAISPFTNNTLEIKEGDLIYLFSDGYADQFGGTKGRKFMYRPFQDLLLKIHKEPLVEQKELLERTFQAWKGDREQVDDVLVIGLKI